MRKIPDTLEATEGDCVTLEAEVTGYPEPTVHWTKADVEITSAMPEYQITQEEHVHRLTIAHVKPAMAALYSAKAQSDAGQTSCRGRLKVKRKLLSKYCELYSSFVL